MICYIGSGVFSFAEAFQHIGIVLSGLNNDKEYIDGR